MLKRDTQYKMTKLRDDGTLEDGAIFQFVVRLKERQWFAEDATGAEHKIVPFLLKPGTNARSLALYGYHINGATWIPVPPRWRTDIVMQ